MSTPLPYGRIPKKPDGFTDEWASEPCELCGKELGHEEPIRVGAGCNGWQHVRCSLKVAVKALLEASKSPSDAANHALDALEKLGVDGDILDGWLMTFSEPDEAP